MNPTLRTVRRQLSATALVQGFIRLLAAMAVGTVLHAPEARAADIMTTVALPRRDGTTLAADVYTPAGRGSGAVIVMQTPYGRGSWSPIFTVDQNTDPLFKNPNYAWVIVDWRGYFGSASARYSGSPTLGQDGNDVVEWVATQPFSNGKVGAYGVSALGTSVLATAQEAPPHLVAGVPVQYQWRDSYALSYPGGVFYKNRDSSPFGNSAWTSGHPLYDSWWTNYEATMNPVTQVKIPMLHMTGWYDHMTDTTLSEMQRVQTGGAAGAIGTQKALIGPWTHAHVTDSAQGQLSYPDAATIQASAAIEYFDYTMRGIANGYNNHAMYRYYQTNEARMVDSPVWPPSNVGTQTYYLHGDATLSTTAPASNETPRSYVADPSNPVPTLWGAVLTTSANANLGPGDLRPNEARADVLSFTTAPMTSAVAIAGRPRVHVNLTSTAVDTDINARITQVHADGTSMLIVDSAHRVSLRSNYTTRSLLTSGTAYAVDVDLPSIAITIPAGDRLRVEIAPSNYDRFDKNMQDGSSLSTQTGAVATVATIQILLDSAHQSTIALPVTSAVPTPPAAPTNLVATAVSTSGINLTWTDGSSTETGFMIRRSTDNVNFVTVASTSANNTSFSDTGLSSSTTYYYRVHSFNDAGNSDNASASATTMLAPPAAPSGLKYTALSKNNVSLAWTDNSTNETNFKLQRSTDNKTWLLMGTLSPNVTTFSQGGLFANKLYYYRVYATNSAGSSAYSTLTLTTPAK